MKERTTLRSTEETILLDDVKGLRFGLPSFLR